LIYDVGVSQDMAYTTFVDNFLQFQRAFKYSSSITEVMDLPYRLYYDLFNKQNKLEAELNK